MCDLQPIFVVNGNTNRLCRGQLVVERNRGRSEARSAARSPSAATSVARLGYAVMVQSRSNRQLYTAPASSLTVKSELYCVYVFGSDAWEYDICGNTRYVRGTASRDEHVHQTCDMPHQSPRAITTSYSSGDNIATRTSVSRRASDGDLAEEYCAGSHGWVSSKPSMDMRLKGCNVGRFAAAGRVGEV